MSNEIDYTIIKSVNIEVAMNASEKTDKAAGTAKKEGELCWAHTVCTVMDRIDLGLLDQDNASKDNIEVTGKVIKKILADHIIATTTIPAEGKNRVGKTFKTHNDDGTVKWGSWSKTRRIFDYAGVISKILCFGHAASLYPEMGKVGGRGKVLALCKVAEGHMKAIERLSDALQSNLDMVANSTEVAHAHLKVSALTVNDLDPVDEMKALITKLDGLLGVVAPSERKAVLNDLGGLSSHFNKDEV